MPSLCQETFLYNMFRIFPVSHLRYHATTISRSHAQVPPYFVVLHLPMTNNCQELRKQNFSIFKIFAVMFSLFSTYGAKWYKQGFTPILFYPFQWLAENSFSITFPHAFWSLYLVWSRQLYLSTEWAARSLLFDRHMASAPLQIISPNVATHMSQTEMKSPVLHIPPS